MSRLHDAISTATAEGRMALIPYLPYRFPDHESFWTSLAELDASGADIIEIGVPFSDPVADGPLIEATCQECLERGATLEGLLAELPERARLKGGFRAALVLMGYFNPFLQYGLDRLSRDCAAAGVSGLIIPDLPYEEQEATRAALEAHGLDLVPLVGLNTSPERMRLYADTAKGFAYVVSVLGTTGARDSLPSEVAAKLAQAREVFGVPLALGFGIRTPEQIEGMKGLVDAVVFGSALIRHIKDGGTAAGFMQRWTA